MIKKFTPFTKIDTTEMSIYVNSMYEVLIAMDKNLIPNEKDYSIKELTNYIKSLIKNQRNDLNNIQDGSWSVAPDTMMPSDARVDFNFRPTYIAISTLTIFNFRYPDIVNEISNFKKALKSGMLFSTYRGLSGHGYGGTYGMIDAMKILSIGKVPLYLYENPEFSPELNQIVMESIKYIQESLNSGDTKGAWGEDYREDFSSILELIKLKNGNELLSS
ncbi:MAG: hypothetical protein KDK36_08690 [Leptospiraceae bacterium]|nr:hypothetical protein [Leptospiraceae bacterium]